MTDLAWLVLVAAVFGTAAFSAVVGMGGGVTLLAVMTAVLPPPVVVPLHGVVQLTSNTTRALLLLRRVHWPIFAYFAAPATVGVWIGARWYTGGPLGWFRPAVGAFILCWLISLWRQPRLGRLPEWIFAPLGLAVGTLASLIGATGPLIAPFFLREDLDQEQVVATKASVQLVTHAAKVPAFFALGFDYRSHVSLLIPLLLAAMGGTWAGRRLLARIPVRVFRALFAATLAAIALHLLFGRR